MREMCKACSNWTEDLELLEGDGICNVRAEHGGLTRYDFKCCKYDKKFKQLTEDKKEILKNYCGIVDKSIEGKVEDVKISSQDKKLILFALKYYLKKTQKDIKSKSLEYDTLEYSTATEEQERQVSNYLGYILEDLQTREEDIYTLIINLDDKGMFNRDILLNCE